MKRHPNGFTLLEMLITVVLIGILASFAVPAFRDTVQNNQLTACSNKLVSALQVARSQAVTLRETILVSDAGSNNLSSFRVGRDPDGDNFVDTPDMLQLMQCEGNGLTIVEQNANATFVSFGPTGFRADGQGELSFLTCNEMGAGRILRVTNGGSISSSEAPNGSC